MGVAALSIRDSWMQALFAPLPSKEEAKGFRVHCNDYLETTEGVQASFEFLARCFEVLKIEKSPLTEVGALAERVQSMFENSAEALDLPNLVFKPYQLVSDLGSCFDPFAGPLPFVRRVKEVAIDGMLVVRAMTKTVLLANATQIYLLAARPLFQFSLAATVSTLVADTSDLIRDCIILNQDDHTDETALLALANVVKNLASVIIGALLVSQLLVGVAVWSGAMIIGWGFVFSTARISSYFIKKMVVEPARQLSV